MMHNSRLLHKIQNVPPVHRLSLSRGGNAFPEDRIGDPEGGIDTLEGEIGNPKARIPAPQGKICLPEARHNVTASAFAPRPLRLARA